MNPTPTVRLKYPAEQRCLIHSVFFFIVLIALYLLPSSCLMLLRRQGQKTLTIQHAHHFSWTGHAVCIAMQTVFCGPSVQTVVP
jgi:hypothetical protein